MQKPLIVLDKGRVGRDPQSESILLFSVINESYAAETRKNQTSQSEIPRILSNLETIPGQKEKCERGPIEGGCTGGCTGCT